MITLYGVATLFAVLAMVSAAGPKHVVWAVAAVFLLVLWAGIRALGYWEVTEFQKSFLTRLVSGLKGSGEAALRSVEQDFARMESTQQGWARLCEAAWELGITEMHLTPAEGWEAACPELHGTDPTASLVPAPAAFATWSIDCEVDGEVVGKVVARRPLIRVDFDPARLVSLVRELVRRHKAGEPRAISRPAAAGRYLTRPLARSLAIFWGVTRALGGDRQ